MKVKQWVSMVAFVLMPILAWLWVPAAFPALLLLTLVLLGRHHSNIRKLLSGEELGFRKKS